MLSKTNRAVIAKCAINMKKNGKGPTYTNVIAACPKATITHKSGEPFSGVVVFLLALVLVVVLVVVLIVLVIVLVVAGQMLVFANTRLP